MRNPTHSLPIPRHWKGERRLVLGARGGYGDDEYYVPYEYGDDDDGDAEDQQSEGDGGNESDSGSTEGRIVGGKKVKNDRFKYAVAYVGDDGPWLTPRNHRNFLSCVGMYKYMYMITHTNDSLWFCVGFLMLMDRFVLECWCRPRRCLLPDTALMTPPLE